MLRKQLSIAVMAALALAFTLGAGSARAEPVVYILDYAPDPKGAPAPYVKVTVDNFLENAQGLLDQVTVTFDAGIFNYWLTKAGGENIGVNFGPTFSSVTGLAYVGNVLSGATITIGSNESFGGGLGKYLTVGISSSNGASPPLTDKIVLTALGEWASAWTVLAPNPDNANTVNSGRLLAAHVAPKNDLTNTFPVGDNPPGVPDSAVPIPAAAWLFGTGLLGLIGIARRKPRAA